MKNVQSEQKRHQNDVVIIKFEHISQLFVLFLLLNLSMHLCDGLIFVEVSLLLLNWEESENLPPCFFSLNWDSGLAFYQGFYPVFVRMCQKYSIWYGESDNLLDPRPSECPIKPPLSVCSSACQFGYFFFRNGSLVFSDFVHHGR